MVCSSGQAYKSVSASTPFNTWFAIASSFSPTDSINGAAYSASLDTWVFVGDSGKISYSKDDCVTNVPTSNGFSPTDSIKEVIYCEDGANSAFIAFSSNAICRSTNGIS